MPFFQGFNHLDAASKAMVEITTLAISYEFRDCRIVIVWSPIFNVPVLVMVLFTVTRNVTVPFPLFAAGSITDIQWSPAFAS